MSLLQVNGLVRRFGGVVALRDVELTMEAGETLGMIGPNGSGKTTFVNIVSGHLASDAGTMLFDGETITGASPHQLAARGLTRTYQAVRVFSGLSVARNIETASLLRRDARAGAGAGAGRADGATVDELAEWLRLDRLMGKPAGSLTLFEQRRLELLMRLAQRPRLIMLDEPVGGLALTEVREMIELLAQLKARCSLFVIEHTMRVIRELADRVVVLMAGEKIADGAPDEVLRDKRVVEQYLGTVHA